MFKKFLREYSIPAIIAIGVILSYFAGYSVGKADCEKIPVFIEKPVEASAKITVTSTEATEPAPKR